MAAKRDYYDVLGVSRSASDQEIKKAYRKLCKKYHPDAHPNDKVAAEHFREVNEAYQVLGDEKKKKLYDQYGSAAFDENGGFGGAQGGYRSAGNGGYQEFHWSGGNAQDIFGSMFGDFFGGAGAGGRTRGGFGGGFGGFNGQSASMAGQDVHEEITIGFDEAVNGGERTIRLSGANGSTQSIRFHVPAGIDEGQSIRLRGKGAPGMNGGAAGDLYLKVHISPRPGFERKGQDLYTTVKVPLRTAVLGGEARVSTLSGAVACKIRPGTQSGSKIRLRGKGVVSMKEKNTYGDLYVVVEVEIPRDLSDEEREKFEEFDRLYRRHHG